MSLLKIVYFVGLAWITLPSNHFYMISDVLTRK